MSLMIILFFVVALIGIQVNSCGGYSVAHTKALRGICAIAIMLHHISFNIECENSLLKVFQFAGNFGVAFFFCISGCGCMFHLKARGKRYLTAYWKKRLTRILLPYVTAAVLYMTGYQIIKQPVSLRDVFTGWMVGNPFVRYSWYVFAQIYFYIFFYCAARADLRAGKKFYLLLTLGSILYPLVFRLMGYGENTILTSFCFIAGIGVAKGEERLNMLKTVQKAVIYLGLFVFFAVSLFISNRSEAITSLIFYNLSTAAFALIVLFSGWFIELQKTLLVPLGNISYELYLIHGLMITMLTGKESVYSNWMLFVGIVVTSVFIAATLHWFNEKMIKVFLQERLKKNVRE